MNLSEDDQVSQGGTKSMYFYKIIHLLTLYNVLAHRESANVKRIVFNNQMILKVYLKEGSS